MEKHLQLDQPVNIHITGCVHSCAQHYIGDIGLIGTKVEQGDDMVDGYHILAGGGYGESAAIGREVFMEVASPDAPRVVEAMLTAYLKHRDGKESFAQWSRRHSPEQIREMSESQEILG
jgi:ferredoxin-nitrite reductase